MYNLSTVDFLPSALPPPEYIPHASSQEGTFGEDGEGPETEPEE